MKKIISFIILSFLCGIISFGQSTVKKDSQKKLLTKESQKIIDAHRQIYGMSCIPMSVEMILKLLGRVPADYYDQQNAWKNKSDGNFSNFDGKTISGVTIHKQFGEVRGDNFPLEKLFKTIDRELEAGRYVICERSKDGEFVAVSKDGKKTITDNYVKSTIRKMKGTDILTYELKR